MQIINGKEISNKIFLELKREMRCINFRPSVYDIIVGADRVSLSYVNIKARAAAKLGIDFNILKLDESANQQDLEREIFDINNKKEASGIILQLPLPSHLDKKKALDAILPELDVDVMGMARQEKYYKGDFGFLPPTVAAIWEILTCLKLDLGKKKFLVIGQGELVGRPITHFLKANNFQVSVATSETKSVEEAMKNSNIIISATGVPGLIKGEMLGPSAVVIDAGTSESKGAIVGDVDKDSLEGFSGYYTPVPGGVGPVTVAMLYKNILNTAKNKNNFYAKNQS